MIAVAIVTIGTERQITAGISWLIIARVVLGLGTATQYPAAMGIIPSGARRSKEDASGSTGGGLLVAGLGWRSIFWINLPLAAIAATWVWRAADPDPPADTAATGGLYATSTWSACCCSPCRWSS
jgi:MFS family permease